MRTGLFFVVLGVALLAACGGSTGGGNPDGLGDPGDVASVRLFDGAGMELTFHMPLATGETTRVEVRMYAANGRQIMTVTGGEELDFTFAPSSLASSTPVNGESLIRDVTPTAPPGTPGTLEVALHFPADASTKTFGPFDVLVH
jgi:hypothetical protein